jgi:hypothetical protein
VVEDLVVFLQAGLLPYADPAFWAIELRVPTALGFSGWKTLGLVGRSLGPCLLLADSRIGHQHSAASEKRHGEKKNLCDFER